MHSKGRIGQLQKLWRAGIMSTLRKGWIRRTATDPVPPKFTVPYRVCIEFRVLYTANLTRYIARRCFASFDESTRARQAQGGERGGIRFMKRVSCSMWRALHCWLKHGSIPCHTKTGCHDVIDDRASSDRWLNVSSHCRSIRVHPQ